MVFNLGALSITFTSRFMAISNRYRAGAFLSMLQDFATWQNYQQIHLVYSVRTVSELAYVDRIQRLRQVLVKGILDLSSFL
jgi:hypothetical protein